MMRVGRCVIRTAESVVFTCWHPAPEARIVSIRMSDAGITRSTSSASGSTATVAAEVWMRPAPRSRARAAHGGTRFELQLGEETPSPAMWTEASLIPPSSLSCCSSTSKVQPWDRNSGGTCSEGRPRRAPPRPPRCRANFKDRRARIGRILGQKGEAQRSSISGLRALRRGISSSASAFISGSDSQPSLRPDQSSACR